MISVEKILLQKKLEHIALVSFAAIVNNTGRRRHEVKYCDCGQVKVSRNKTCTDCKVTRLQAWLDGKASGESPNGELKSL